MNRNAARQFLFRHSWDTSCRNIDVAAALNAVAADARLVLDTGCGDNGISVFLGGRKVIGVDVKPPETAADTFIAGSIVSLPFGPGAVSAATAVDVLEHLPASMRPTAIAELVSVARDGMVVSFPFGREARAADEYFRELLARAGMPEPDWLTEHLSDEYPEPAEIAAEIGRAAERTGRRAEVTVTYSERLDVARLLRRAAATSKYLYMAGNLAFGVGRRALGSARAANAYRAIVAAKFSPA
jgi:hypothetical protein